MIRIYVQYIKNTCHENNKWDPIFSDLKLGCSAQQWTPRVAASDPNGLPTELSLLKLDETLGLSQIPSFLSINLDLDFDLFRVFGVLDWR